MSQKNKKKKIILAVIAAILLVGGGWFIYNKFFNNNEKSEVKIVDGIEIPNRKADLNGTIKAIDGDVFTLEVVISDESGLNQMEPGQMQNLSEEEKEAIREARRAARESGTVEVQTELKKVVIPVGTPVVKASTTGMVKGSYADLVEGVRVSVWLDENGNVLVVKVKGV